jgi:hypothetical protein
MYSFKSCREQRSEWIVPSPDMQWVSTARASGERCSKLGCTAQPSEEDFVYLFVFSDASEAGILITI